MERTLQEVLAELEKLWPKGDFPGSHPKIFPLQEELIDLLCGMEDGACMLALSAGSDTLLEAIIPCIEPLLEEKPSLSHPLTALAEARGLDDLLDELSILDLENDD